jgi:hypothetical protein
MHNPDEDGVTHINVYSKGRTWLGRQLSNFAETPFKYDNHIFASVEGWWYWRQVQDDKLLHLHGTEAKSIGRLLVLQSGKIPGAPTIGKLLEVYKAKVKYNPSIEKELRKNVLPFDHYYVMRGGKRINTHHQWTGQLWSEVLK